MPKYGDELDVFDDPGESPKFMTQGWHGHIAEDTFASGQDPADNSNCRVPNFDSVVNKKGY